MHLWEWRQETSSASLFLELCLCYCLPLAILFLVLTQAHTIYTNCSCIMYKMYLFALFILISYQANAEKCNLKNTQTFVCLCLVNQSDCTSVCCASVTARVKVLAQGNQEICSVKGRGTRPCVCMCACVCKLSLRYSSCETEPQTADGRLEVRRLISV